MRAIDADAFKEYITGACEDMKHLFNDGGAVAKLITESFCKDIDEQPTIQPEPHWIPVADGLPNIREDVLVSYYDEVMVGWLNDDGTWFAEGFGRLNMNDIAAWRLLPEPYKEVTT